jgi:spore coat polysaccharide biosynthesis protein SpsF
MIVAIVQARMSSSRLPGKVVMPILGKPMLALQIERLRRCTRIDRLVVATSRRADDDPIVNLCGTQAQPVFRGSLDNVLDRFYQAAKTHGATHVVRLTGDCPLADPECIDDLIRFYVRTGCDYASNCRPPTLPDGLDAEIFSFKTLELAWREAVEPFEKEHVVPFIIKNPQRFRVANFRYHRDLSHLRWTVDEPEDFELIRRIYEALYPENPAFNLKDILRFLERHPELTNINQCHKRNVKTAREETEAT